MNKLAAVLFLSYLFTSCQKELSGDGGGASSISPVITSADVAASIQPDSSISGYVLDSGIISIPIAGIDQRFDYSGVPNGRPWTDTLKAPENLADYPNATYMTGLNLDILGQNISGNLYYQLSNTQWSNLGSYFSPGINVDLQGYALNIPAQASKSNPPQTLVNFPITYNDSINQSSSSAFTFEAGGSFNGFTFSGPITITISTQVKSNNLAYGNLTLRGYNDWMGVVVQRYSTTVTTTFSSTNFIINTLLNGLLTQLGVDPNQSITATEYRFWAVNKGMVLSIAADGSAYVRTGL